MGIGIGAALGGIKGIGEGMAEGAQLTFRERAEAERAKREERNIMLQGGQQRDLEQNVRQPFASEQSRLTREQQSSEGALNRDRQSATSERQAESAESVARINAASREKVARDAQKKEQKPTMPKITPIKDEQGNIIGVFDEHSGAFGAVTPGSPATEAVSRWFSADEPAKPAVPPGIAWQGADRQPIAGLHVFYPEMLGRGVGTGSRAPSASAPQIKDPFQQSGGRPPLASFWRSTTPDKATNASRTSNAPAAPRETPQSRADAEMPAGRDLDRARARVADARAKLQSYGLIQKRRDPGGFEAAQSELDLAKRSEQEALETWQMGIGYNRARPLQAGLLRSK